MNLLTIQTVKGEIAKSFLGYSTLDEAYSAMYSTLASSTANADVTRCICILMDDNGRTHEREEWNRTIIAETTEEQTEEG